MLPIGRIIFLSRGRGWLPEENPILRFRQHDLDGFGQRLQKIFGCEDAGMRGGVVVRTKGNKVVDVVRSAMLAVHDVVRGNNDVIATNTAGVSIPSVSFWFPFVSNSWPGRKSTTSCLPATLHGTSDASLNGSWGRLEHGAADTARCLYSAVKRTGFAYINPSPGRIAALCRAINPWTSSKVRPNGEVYPALYAGKHYTKATRVFWVVPIQELLSVMSSASRNLASATTSASFSHV